MSGIGESLREHPFFRGMAPAHIAFVAGCGTAVRFEPGSMVAQEGAPATEFYAIMEGRVTVEMHVPARGSVALQTVEAGEVLGWSWLFPPHVWMFDGRAVTATRAVRFDGLCLRRKCDEDPVFGCEFMKRFAAVVVSRLRAARLQILDMYGDAGGA